MNKGADLKPRMGVFGKRNAGKSSLINALTGQDIAIVSDVAGTTTDPVKKTMEIKGIGPVVLVDTAGIDDEGALGALRIKKTMDIVEQINIALLVVSQNDWNHYEEGLAADFQKKKIPFVIICSKSDITKKNEELEHQLKEKYNTPIIGFSKYDEQSREALLVIIKALIPETAYTLKSLLGDVIKQNDRILLVTPIDSAAPEGRLILPQVQVIRDILNNNAVAIVCKETELEEQLKNSSPLPDLIVTDSQVFGFVSGIVPQEVPLTSFSIVLARQKGLFDEYIKGTPKILSLKDNDTILLLESCTHQTSCEDIGRVKLPALFRQFTQKELQFEIVPGLNNLPRPISEYALVVQCGGCVVTHKQLVNRLMPALEANIPVSNYGMAIAYMNGIFERAVAIFK